MAKNTNTVEKIDDTNVVITQTAGADAKIDKMAEWTKEHGSVDELKKKYGSLSAVFRYLLSKNMTRGEVAKFTGKRYQHVRNVQVTPIKKSA